MDTFVIVDGKEIPVHYGVFSEIKSGIAKFYVYDAAKLVEIEVTGKEIVLLNEIIEEDQDALFAIDMENKRVVLDGYMKELDEETLVANKSDR